MPLPIPRRVPDIERLGREITAALACLRTARQAATDEPSGYHANQELAAELELDRLLVTWPTRRTVEVEAGGDGGGRWSRHASR